MTRRAVVLARGLGRRMQAEDPAAALTPEQARAARAGAKGMMPINGRPFLDYVLSAIADAGLAQVALVVAPDHGAIEHHYRHAHPPRRLELAFVVQAEPVGTADAVLRAEPWTREEPFLALNSDNLYPSDALRALASLDEPGLAVFTRADLLSSNIPAERLASFALVEFDAAGYLAALVEKPGAWRVAEAGHAGRISMNCWRFDDRIFRFCREVPRSARGELELPEAVELARRAGVRFKGVPAAGPVFDLSRRADLADVARRLASAAPRP